MEKTYAVLERKVENLETQLMPILSAPPDPETPPSNHPVPEGINQHLLFLNNLLSTEIALSPAPDEARHCHLAQIARRVRLLQSTFRKWAEARPTSTSIDPDSAPRCSCTESCLDDEDGEESPLMGFMVFDNPAFAGSDDDYHQDDNNDDWDYQNEEQESEGNKEEEEEVEVIKMGVQEEERREKTDDEEDDEMEECEGVEEEEEQDMMIRADDQNEERREKAEDDEEREYSHNCCLRGIFGIIMIAMGFIFFMVGYSDFSDHHPPVVFLTPT